VSPDAPIVEAPLPGDGSPMSGTKTGLQVRDTKTCTAGHARFARRLRADMRPKGYRMTSGTVTADGYFVMEFESDEGLVWTFRRPCRSLTPRGKKEAEGP